MQSNLRWIQPRPAGLPVTAQVRCAPETETRERIPLCSFVSLAFHGCWLPGPPNTPWKGGEFFSPPPQRVHMALNPSKEESLLGLYDCCLGVRENLVLWEKSWVVACGAPGLSSIFS